MRSTTPPKPSSFPTHGTPGLHDCLLNSASRLGFGEAPAEVARTVLLAAAARVVGGSIEDTTGRSDDPFYSTQLAAERIRAAAEACLVVAVEIHIDGASGKLLHQRARSGRDD